ncbi:MAG: hypothetical protein U0230_16235 [Polyangiales bacterium]
MRPILLVFATLLFVAVEARADEPVAVLVGPSGPELLHRVEGQLADLEWRFVHRPAGSAGTLAAAFALGESQHARVVATLEETSDAIVLDVVDVPERRRFTRRFEGGSATARREEAAVVLRSSLVAIGLGGEIGVQVPAVAPPPPPVPNEPPPEAPPPRSSSLGLDLAVLGQMAFDGLAGPSLGPGGRIGLWRKRLSLAVVTTFGWPRTIRATDVDLVVTRSTVAFRVAGAVYERPHVRVVVGGSMGVEVLGRITSSTAGALVATDRTRRAYALASADVTLQLFPGRGRRLGLELGAGVDVPMSQPTFSVAQGEVERVVASAWWVEPKASVGLVVRTDVGATERGR